MLHRPPASLAVAVDGADQRRVPSHTAVADEDLASADSVPAVDRHGEGAQAGDSQELGIFHVRAGIRLGDGGRTQDPFAQPLPGRQVAHHAIEEVHVHGEEQRHHAEVVRADEVGDAAAPGRDLLHRERALHRRRAAAPEEGGQRKGQETVLACRAEQLLRSVARIEEQLPIEIRGDRLDVAAAELASARENAGGAAILSQQSLEDGRARLGRGFTPRRRRPYVGRGSHRSRRLRPAQRIDCVRGEYW